MYRNTLAIMLLLCVYTITSRAQNTTLQDAFKHVEDFYGLLHMEECMAVGAKVVNPSSITTAVLEFDLSCPDLAPHTYEEVIVRSTLKIPVVALADIKEFDWEDGSGISISALTDAFSFFWNESASLEKKKELDIYISDRGYDDMIKAFKTMLSAAQNHQAGQK